MLKIENISKTFSTGTADAKLALDGVSLHAKRGDFITVIGANGAGKSTLFNAICGWTAKTLPTKRITSARGISAGCFRTPCAAVHRA